MVVFMDAQLKKGLLEQCVLATLNRESSYGYKIMKDIGAYIEITESTLYPILRRLEDAGHLSTYTREWSGRLRKYYTITESGKQKLGYFKEEWLQMKNIYEYIVM